MSKFSKFMKANKIERRNEKFAVTLSLKDDNGKPLVWEFRPITSKENDDLREAATYEVQVTGKPNLFRPKLNTAKYISSMIVASTVVPDLYDAELQDSYNVKTPEELLYAMVDDPGEYNDLGAWIQRFQGFTEGLDERIEEAKN